MVRPDIGQLNKSAFARLGGQSSRAALSRVLSIGARRATALISAGVSNSPTRQIGKRLVTIVIAAEDYVSRIFSRKM
jgi:hypothetical protein